MKPKADVWEDNKMDKPLCILIKKKGLRPKHSINVMNKRTFPADPSDIGKKKVIF